MATQWAEPVELRRGSAIAKEERMWGEQLFKRL